MNLEKHRGLSLLVYILSIAFYGAGIVVIYKYLFDLHFFYLFITIPLLFLLVVLTVVNAIKIVFVIISMIFGRNDNSEINNTLKKGISYVNRTCKYTLIGIFAALLSSIMILDIILCIQKEMYLLISLSIVVWILLYYLLFRMVVKMIKKEIRL